MLKYLLENIIKIIIEKFKKKIEKKEEDKIEYVPILDEIGSPTRAAMDTINFNKRFKSIEPSNYREGEYKTFLIVDDIELSELLYTSDFKRIKKTYDKDILEDFIYYPCFQQEAGFMVYDLLFNKNIKIDYAILDLTLGYDFKLPSGDFIQLDGVDLANYLLQSNPDVKFLFCSAHTMNHNNNVIHTYIEKYQKLTNTHLDTKFICKNSKRQEGIYNLLYGG